MAGNIVKWWKHKILGGYKQFSVQECTTDSEELMYHQVRAPSSCSAPPDLLLVSDPENNIPLKSPVVNIITATAAAAATSSSSHKQQQSTPHQHHQNTKEFYNKNAQNMKLSSGKNGGRSINFQAAAAISSNAQQQHEAHQPQFRHHSKEEQRIHLEEFTCDVSVEGGKSSQPLQFSFTFYDLDGHHGKITKDDIVGIVYTIYESIGKSVVVPHCGSKTINVRLTVSPEGKAKASASKLKKVHPGGNSTPLETANCKPPTAAASAMRRQHRYRPRKLIKSDDEDDDSTSEKDIQLTAMAASASASASAAANKSKSHATKYNSRAKSEQPQPLAAIAAAVGRNCCQATENNRNVGNRNHAETATSGCHHDSNLYENLRPAKFCAPKEPKKCEARLADECRECAATTFAGGQSKASDVYLKQTSTRVKMLRKARKQKYQDHCMESRQRSLSLGSGTCWQSRHAKHSPHFDSSKQPPALYSQLQQQPPPQPPTEDFIDGVQLRKPRRVGRPSSLAPHRSSGECWKSAVQRSDLVSILRQSMEKNRLSFQLHGKPQANVSPIRHSHQRQRSNTVSKIPTLIANHSSSITSYNNSNSNCNRPSNNEPNIHDINTSCQRQQHPQQQQQQPQQQQQQQQPQLHQNHHHLQPHIPIYHQQLAINPAVLAAQSGFVHSKANLCGYDSFLHATICGGGTSHSPPPPAPPPPLNCGTGAAHTQQPIAAVQPIMNAINAAHQPQQQQQQQRPSPKIYAHPTATHQQIKTSKILRSGSFSQQQHAEPSVAAAPLLQHSSPQFHGYQRLSSASATKHNLAALNSQNPSVARTQVEHLERWLHEREKCAASAPKSQKSKKDVKNYDNLLFAKLTEKLQDSSLNAADALEAEQRRLEVEQRRKQRAFARAQKANAANDASHCSGPGSKNSAANKQQQQVQMIVSPVTSEQSNYAALVPINGDPMECENLLGSQTSDEDNSTAAAATKDPSTAATNEEALQLQITGDLLHFNDDADNAAEGEVEKAQPQVLEGNSEHARSGSSNSNSGAALVATSSGNAANSASVSSSLVHRYVHEHIHHHYHHFEDKTD